MRCMTEVEHMIYKNCRNVAHGRQTNFSRITASPEALAEFIGSVLDCCSDVFGECKHCPLDKACIADKGFKQSALEWLKQENK